MYTEDSRRRDVRIVQFLLGILVLFVVGVVFQQLRSVLLPLVIATLLSYLFKPVVIYLRARGVPIFVGLIVVLLIVSILGFALGLIVYSSTESFIEALPRYEARVESMIDNAQNYIAELAARFNIDLGDFLATQTIQVSDVTDAVQTGLSSFLVVFSTAFLILLFMLFILAASGAFGEKITAAFSTGDAERMAAIIRNIDTQIKQYLVAKTLISLGTGALATIILAIMGVDFALFWGFLTFLLNYIPNIGSMLATLFPVLVSFIQFDSIVYPFVVLALLAGSQGVMGNVVEPRILASSLNLSPLLILVSLIFWGWLWGAWGMVLAVPIVATIKIVLENIEPLKPIAVLMAGRPSRKEKRRWRRAKSARLDSREEVAEIDTVSPEDHSES